jgi:hypothetical protein
MFSKAQTNSLNDVPEESFRGTINLRRSIDLNEDAIVIYTLVVPNHSKYMTHRIQNTGTQKIQKHDHTYYYSSHTQKLFCTQRRTHVSRQSTLAPLALHLLSSLLEPHFCHQHPAMSISVIG